MLNALYPAVKLKMRSVSGREGYNGLGRGACVGGAASPSSFR